MSQSEYSDLPKLLDISKIIDLNPEIPMFIINPIDAVNKAASNGKIDIVKNFYKVGYECTSCGGYSRALREGHLEVVKFLNENCKKHYFPNYDIEGTLIHSKNEKLKEYIRNHILKK